MNLLKRLYFSGVPGLNIEWLKKKSPLDILIPYHHLVSAEPVPYIQPLYSFKTPAQFESDLDFLLKHFQPVSLTEIIDHRKRNIHFSKKSFLLTFDDGLRQVYEIAAPILLRKGVPAALFINPAFVDNKEIFYDFKKGLILSKLAHRKMDASLLTSAEKLFGEKISSSSQLEARIRSINYLNRDMADAIGQLLEIDFDAFGKKQRPFMTTGEISELVSKGFHLGAHSIDHPLYALITEEQQIQQTVDSTEWVAKTFNLSYKAFAFPHTDTGVKHSFFEQLVGTAEPKIDLILGNSTAMMENHHGVEHRFIGENPDIPVEKMAKAVLSYSAFNKMAGRPFVKRNA
jgi:peptidoglycan/xylan/chitin deacetylase (PgdA/CDA1 family)